MVFALPSYYSSNDLADLLIDDPKEAGRFRPHDWGKIDGEDWARLLSARPEFAGKCRWGEVSDADWVELLRTRPEFADSCPDKTWEASMWKALTARDWAWLLAAQPQLAKFRNGQ